MSSATTQRPNGLALFILPSALLFALFFFLPIGLMALMSVLTGNPVVAPKVAFTTRHYARMIGTLPSCQSRSKKVQVLDQPFAAIRTLLRVSAPVYGFPLYFAHEKG